VDERASYPKENAGFTGWDRKVPYIELEMRIAEKLFSRTATPQSYVDIANLAMFLFFRQNGTLNK
jgi:hypothetical protein